MKSLCFQIPALLFENKTIVVSPLVSLMDDQVNTLKDLNVKAERMHSDMAEDVRANTWEQFRNGDIKILYISPESLMQKTRIAELQALKISMFVVDEAHCISKWGASFRKDYEQLKDLKTFFPEAIISAFTATADEETREDINNKLTDGKGKIFLNKFNRPNLSLAYKKKTTGVVSIRFPRRKNQAGIVYCLVEKIRRLCLF